MAVAKMPRKPRVDFEAVKPRLIADWRTGAYTVQSLAAKHRVSIGFTHKHIKDVPQDMKATVNKIVEVKQTLMGVNEFCVTAVNEVALNRVKFEAQNDARMELVSLKAMEFLEVADKITDLTPIMGVLKTQREAKLGKAPDTAIQINNSEAAGLKINLVQYGEQSPDQ